jgi:hypothetical protein
MTNEAFNFWNEKKAYDLDSFVSCLDTMSDEEFSSYVNNSKNDFANWIEGSLQYIELAEKIRPFLEKDLIRVTVVNYMGAEKNKLMIGVSKDIQTDSLIKEVLQKNEEFLKNADLNRTDAAKFSVEKETAEVKKNTEEEVKSSKSEKGSKLSFVDLPGIKKGKSENKISRDFFVGVVFGVIIGALITLIVIQLIAL